MDLSRDFININEPAPIQIIEFPSATILANVAAQLLCSFINRYGVTGNRLKSSDRELGLEPGVSFRPFETHIQQESEKNHTQSTNHSNPDEAWLIEVFWLDYTTRSHGYVKRLYRLRDFQSHKDNIIRSILQECDRGIKNLLENITNSEEET